MNSKLRGVRLLKNHIVIVIIVLGWISLHQSCTHDPTFMMDIDPDPMDTMTIDTMGMDTTGMDTTMTGIPCDPEVVYFKRDILPIFVSNCALSGCHDAATATEGIVLDNFENIVNTGEVEPFDLSDSEVYEVITEDDPDKLMPPSGKLDNAQINLIATWILQGAKDLECDEDQEPCNTEDVSYSGFVKGVLNTNCNGCHGTGVANGGIITDTYEGVKSAVNAGRFYGAINWDEGFSRMPQGLGQLDQCTLDKIKSWIDAGAEDN